MRKTGIDNSATGARLKQLREDILELSQEEFAKGLKVSRGAVGNWELGKGIKRENLVRIAKLHNVSFEWLAMGHGPAPTFGDMMPTAISEPVNRRQKPNATAGGIPHLVIHGGLGDGGLLDVLSDGNGQVLEEYTEGAWQLPPSAEALLPNLKHVYAMRVTGDSMEPTLPGGSYVFVDTNHRVASPDDIYALNYGDGLMVKRVKLVPRSSKMLIISDNERYGTDELHRNVVEIYGRVVAWFQWRG